MKNGGSAIDQCSPEELYRKLPDFAETRRKELTSMFASVVELTDSYGVLVSRGVAALGTTPTQSRRKIVVRDLIPDVFDFLYEWRRPLFEGRLHVAYPLARRAYESLSLLSVCYQDASIADRWDSGRQISNSEIRKALASLPFPEREEALRDLYAFFSKAAHPNRDLVSERHLGNGNEFVLGSIMIPDLLLTLDHCTHLIDMWFWFGALVAHIAHRPLKLLDTSFYKDYSATADEAARLKRQLAADYNDLLKRQGGETP